MEVIFWPSSGGEFHTQRRRALEERWQDHLVASEQVVAELKADPKNRYAQSKAWLAYVVKISLYSLVGSAVLLLTLYIAMPQIWVDASVGQVLRIWGYTAFFGPMFLPLFFTMPVRYWERRADKILADSDVPHNHKTF